MKPTLYRKWIPLVCYVAAAFGSGCLDLDLLDDMEPLDTDTVDETDRSAAEETEPREDTEGAPPAADANDHTPPVISDLTCSASERMERGVCIAEGPVSASIRFRTDEPSTIRCAPETGDEARAGMLSQPWRLEHRGAAINLPADAETVLSLTLTDINGNEQQLVVSVRGSGGPAVAITEVLADPSGTEPTQEWVEIVNFGAAPVDLSGWMLDDNDDHNGDVLPSSSVLDAGQIALLVPDAYIPDDGEDPAPADGTRLIYLDNAVGTNGLKNGDAEKVILYDAAGTIISVYDGRLGPPKEGISASREYAELPDADPSAFATDPSGLSSPGISPRLTL